MDFLQNYITLVTVGICLCVGYVLKNLVPTKKLNKFIPLIVLVIGVFINIWVSGWVLSPEILLGGMVSGLASTGLHQAFKQFIGKK